jgi:hypothetical protein
VVAAGVILPVLVQALIVFTETRSSAASSVAVIRDGTTAMFGRVPAMVDLERPPLVGDGREWPERVVMFDTLER